MKWYLLIMTVSMSFPSFAQKVNQHIQKGNDSYREKKYDQAQQEYSKALKADSKNAIAAFNSGNALHKMDKPEDASKVYDLAASNTKDMNVKAQALNNQGLSLIKQKKLPEAIEAFKQSLRLYSFDKEVRENLQKALNELKKQQSQNQDQNKNKSQKENEDKKKDKSKMSEEQAERLLKQLQQDEKDTQKQLRKRNRKDRQIKDW